MPAQCECHRITLALPLKGMNERARALRLSSQKAGQAWQQKAQCLGHGMVLVRVQSQDCKKSRSFDEADKIRDDLRAMGVNVQDTERAWSVGRAGEASRHSSRQTSRPSQLGREHTTVAYYNSRMAGSCRR